MSAEVQEEHLFAAAERKAGGYCNKQQKRKVLLHKTNPL
jgi:hypothetical protein